MTARTLAMTITLLSFAAFAAAPSATRAETPPLAPGRIELGLSGALLSVEGTSTVDLALRGGYLLGAAPRVFGAELELGFAHVQELERLDLGGSVFASQRIADSAAHAYLGLGASLRQEWVGSFSQALYPVGFDLGVRIVLSPRAALRGEYRFRHVLNDPSTNFTEHQLRWGLSVFLGG